MQRRRIALFLFGCITTRLLTAEIVRRSPPSALPYYGALALLPALGFALIYAMDLRKSGPETFGEPIWWNNLRPVHALFYTVFAGAAFRQSQYSWAILTTDALFGLASWIVYHFIVKPTL